MSVCCRSFVLGALVSWWAFSVPLHAAAADDTTTIDQTERPSVPGNEGAAANQPETLETSEVVISATKTPVPVSQLTSAVEVITGEQMQQRKLKTVVDA